MIVPAGWSLAARIGAPLLLVALLLAGVWGYGQRQYLRGAGDERERVQLEAARKLVRVLDVQMEAMNHANDEAARARRDAAAAGDAAGRLRQRVAQLSQRAAAACPGQAAGDPIGVLADVLGRADARAGILAEYADRARVAGQACERAYDALTR